MKRLPNMGPISFAELITSKQIKATLNKGEYFTIDMAIKILAEQDPDTLFFKGQNVTGFADAYSKGRQYKRKCNVQLLLWEMTDKGTENFTIFERAGNGKYRFKRRAFSIVQEKKKQRSKFVERSRIKGEVDI